MNAKQTLKRRQEVLDHLQPNSVALFFSGDLIPSTADEVHSYELNRNFFYLTHCEEDGLILMLQNTGLGKKETLFIKDDNPLHEKWMGRTMKQDEALQRSGIKTILPLSQFETVLNRVFLNNDIQILYIDAERMSLKQRGTAVEHFAHELQEAHPALKIVNLNKNINKKRRIKDEDELKHMSQAIETTHRALNRVLRELKAGRTEYQAAADFSYQLALENKKHAFGTIAASGADATILHYRTNGKILKDGDLLLLDCGSADQYYCSDITRTYPVSGRFTDRQKELYTIVLKAQEAVIDAIKPGVSLQFLNEIVKEVYRQEAVKAKVIDDPSQVEEIYYHGVSHSLGLDTHDVGNFEGSVLEAGMVITVEPGLYSAKEGVGIRIEDDVLVTETGSKVLSSAIEKSIESIEKIMSSSQG